MTRVPRSKQRRNAVRYRCHAIAETVTSPSLRVKVRAVINNSIAGIWRTRVLWLWITAVVCGYWPTAPLAEPMPLEYQVKAVYIYNFLRFVDWPPDTFATESDPIQVCVVGEHPVGRALAPIETQAARGRAIQLHILEPRSQFKHCQVLFIGTRNANLASTLLEQVENTPVLTVSDMDRFVALGGMIGFVIKEDHVSLEINLREIRAADLRISAKVLEIASTVIAD